MKTSKKMNNLEIVELLKAVSASYKIKDPNKNRFKVIAYNRAADAIEHLSSEAKDLWDEGKLEDVSGIGKSIAEHLGEIFATGKSTHFEKILKGLPSAMFDLMKVPGIGAKTAYTISNQFKDKFKGKSNPFIILEKLATGGEIAKLEGFGNESQDAILTSVKDYKKKPKKRMLLPYASALADEIITWMKESKDSVRIDPLGSLRRKVSTVGDIDISVATNKPTGVLEHFTEYPKATRVLEKGERTASIILPGNRQVDLMVETPDAYGALLQHFTGSKHHNIAIRKLALKKGFSVSDYGISLVKGKVKRSKIKIKNYNPKLKKFLFRNEENFYKFLGMEWIPPVLREDTGEIDAAINNKVPNLIKLSDVRGDLHIHSDFDIETSHDIGDSSMEDMVKKAGKLGYEYIAFTEHNPSKSKHSQRQIIELIKRKKEKIDRINESLSLSSSLRVGRVFNSLEIDILPDGSLPVDDKGLELLDFALVSIHSSFNQSKSSMTERVLKGLDRLKVKIFAHPTARKLNERESIELDWDKIFEFCKGKDKWLEINAAPSRLDLPSMLVKDATRHGIGLTLGTDSHHVDAMDLMEYGVSVARRGWAEGKDIVNTRSLNEFEKMLE